LRYFIDDFERRERVASDVRARTWYALSRAGLTIPAPQRRVELVRARSEVSRRAEGKQSSRHELLASLTLFQVLPPEEIHRLSTRSTSRVYGPGDVIVRAGDVGGELFVIRRGEVAVRSPLPGGRFAEVARLGAGDFFGEVALLTGERRGATVVAQMETELAVIARDTMGEAMALRPELADEIGRVLAERRQALQQVLGSHGPPPSSVSREEEHQELLDRIRRFFSL
jgi:branched-chain amino acid transport system substrate-binding protein